MGSAVIQKGLSKYLEAHKFGNAVTNDLWIAIQDAWTEDRQHHREREIYHQNTIHHSSAGANSIHSGSNDTAAHDGIKDRLVIKTQGSSGLGGSTGGGLSGSDHYNFTVKEMMDTWTLQTGYPIVSFVPTNVTNIYSIQQSRYLTALKVHCME